MLFSSLHHIHAPVFESGVEHIEAIIKDIILIASLHFKYLAVCGIFILKLDIFPAVYSTTFQWMFCFVVLFVVLFLISYRHHTISLQPYYRPELFPLVLGYSQKCVVRTHSADFTWVWIIDQKTVFSLFLGVSPTVNVLHWHMTCIMFWRQVCCLPFNINWAMAYTIENRHDWKK